MSFVLAGMLVVLSCRADVDWFPQPVLADGKPASYQALPHARQRWRLCALLPQGKDHFFWAVSYGLFQEAARSGVDIGIYEAGGYGFGAVQRKQLSQCEALHADAYLIAAIAADELGAEITKLRAQGKVVVDLVNGMPDDLVDAHSHEAFEESSAAAARCLLQDARQRPVKVAWLPGPLHANWADGFTAGMRHAFKDKPVEVTAELPGSTDMGTQMGLVRRVIEGPPVDYIFGNAVAAEAAARLLARRPDLHVKVVSTYLNEALLPMIERQQVLCAPTVSPVLQARIAVDQAIRVLEGKPSARLVSPTPQLVDAETVKDLKQGNAIEPAGAGFMRAELPALRER